MDGVYLFSRKICCIAAAWTRIMLLDQCCLWSLKISSPCCYISRPKESCFEYHGNTIICRCRVQSRPACTAIYIHTCKTLLLFGYWPGEEKRSSVYMCAFMQEELWYGVLAIQRKKHIQRIACLARHIRTVWSLVESCIRGGGQQLWHEYARDLSPVNGLQLQGIL
jgi:hypothetical protein